MLGLHWVKSHPLDSLNSHLPLLSCISIIDSHHLCNLVLHFVSNNQGSPVFESFWHWFDIVLSKVRGQLFWNLSKDLLCQLYGVFCTVSEWDELDNVSLRIFVESLRVERGNISIELHH